MKKVQQVLMQDGKKEMLFLARLKLIFTNLMSFQIFCATFAKTSNEIA